MAIRQLYTKDGIIEEEYTPKWEAELTNAKDVEALKEFLRKLYSGELDG